MRNVRENDIKKAIQLNRTAEHLDRGQKDALILNKFKETKTAYTFKDKIVKFLKESNAIEGIDKDITKEDFYVSKTFIEAKKLLPENILAVVKHFEPEALLRNKLGRNAYLTAFIPPKGGAEVENAYLRLIRDFNALGISSSSRDIFDLHREYETLHPFTDCNGRSGRLIWLWSTYSKSGFLPDLSFLHLFYYYGLSLGRSKCII